MFEPDSYYVPLFDFRFDTEDEALEQFGQAGIERDEFLHYLFCLLGFEDIEQSVLDYYHERFVVLPKD
jgi:hypothetical protein